MRIFNINIFNPNFKGQRQDRKSVAQLKQENAYDLNVPNQRKINEAINRLATVPGEDNAKFLMDVAENLQYGTNIDLEGKKSYNDWQTKLRNATENSLALSDKSVQEKLSENFNTTFSTQKPLTNTEKEILAQRKSLLEKVNPEDLENIKNPNIKNLKRNLDYLIVSSEVPTSQKLYILKRLNYFMSPEYKINEQLKDKKTQALAEMINDLVVNTPESKIPNIKAINQRGHGICAAISICRKALAYEDKPNYVDMILSELDNSNELQVYDISKLGSHTKIPIDKIYIDFDYALSKGYRIVDTSAMYWMNVADTAGPKNNPIGSYSPFDKSNFDTFNDAHIIKDISNELVNQHDYFRSLVKAKEALVRAKKSKLKDSISPKNNKDLAENNLELIQAYRKDLVNILKSISPNLSNNTAYEILRDLENLEVPTSQKLNEIKDYKKDFSYLPNETTNSKLEKIKAFLSISLPKGTDSDKIQSIAPDVIDITDKIKEYQPEDKSSIAARNINRAKLLYNAAAAYRTQQVFQLDIPERRLDMMESLNISDDETRILENMDKLIKKLNKNEINPELRSRLAKNFESSEDNLELAEKLKNNRDTVEYILTDIMDDLYKTCLSVSRKNVLLNELKGLQEAMLTNPEEETIIELASRLQVKENPKIIAEELQHDIESLEAEDCTNEKYIKLYNKYGHKSQLIDFKNTIERLASIIFDEKNQTIIRGFNAINGANPDAPMEVTTEIFNTIAQNFNNISGLINGYQQALKIIDDNNNILNTTDSKEIILKKLENMGEIPTVKELKTLQDHFTRIDQAKANNENLKLKDLPTELTSLSKFEKEILKKYEYNINSWYSMTTRRLDAQYKEIKEPLNELNREIGVQTGNRWVSSEGHSGLNSRQQVKIIEHMTDRPYYIEYDGKLALNKIKESPYSGISSTSVLHTEPAWHAQYIVDVKPITINNNGQKEVKDTIVHDNTWGAAEHENTWIDENGLTRTDYSNDYGGELGYITDENYRNGKIADNLFNKVGVIHSKNIDSKLYKKLNKGDDNGIKFPLFSDIILPGEYPNSMQYIQQIRDNTLISPIAYLDDLEKYAHSMTKAQILNSIKKVEEAGKLTNEIYENYIKRIEGKEPFNNGIKTLEDYNKLSDNDDLKILLEKIALIKSYPSMPDIKSFYQKNQAKDIVNIKQKIRKEARKNFDYAFSKSPEITEYGTESSRKELNEILDKFLKTNNISIANNKINIIINSLKHIDNTQFDGNLEHTIDLMSKSFESSMLKNTPDFENKQEKIQILANSIKNILQTNMGFTLADLDTSSFSAGKMKSIVDWIDNTFDPATDEEFVQVFNKLQNMTTKEFKENFDSKISDKDLGIKPITGYDVLVQINSENEKTHNSLFNIIYQQECSKNMQLSRTIPSYDYKKFERKLHGARYVKGQRSFDDIYMDYYYSLLSLTLDKRYNKIRQQVFDKYGMFPAYPKIAYESEEDIEEITNKLYSDISNGVGTINTYKKQIKSFEIMQKLSNNLNKLPANHELTNKQMAYVSKKLNEFSNINKDDETILYILEKIQNTLATSKTAGDFKNLVDFMWHELKMYEKTADGRPLADAVESQLNFINENKKDFIRNAIDPKYHKQAFEILNKWITAKAKEDYAMDMEEDTIPQSDIIFAQFKELYEKHRFTKTPEKILNEFLLLNAKDSRPIDANLSGEKAINTVKELQTMRTTYKINLAGLLYNANLLDIQYILMDCAKQGNLNVVKENFKKSTLKLKNGNTIPLDSDIGLSIILSPLITEVDLATALMFIDQFDLSEKVMGILTKDTSFEKEYKNLKRIASIKKSIYQQQIFIDKAIKSLGNIDNNPNYINDINRVKEDIARRIKNSNYRLTSEIYAKAIENALTEMENRPDCSKTALLISNIETAHAAAKYVADNHFEKLNTILYKVQNTFKIVNAIEVPANSKAQEQKNKYIEGFYKLQNYKEDLDETLVKYQK